MEQAQTLGQFTFSCIAEPRTAFARARSLGLSNPMLWGVVALTAILRVGIGVLVSGVIILLWLGTTSVALMPMTYFSILFGTSVIMVFALHYSAKSLGGKGKLSDSLLAVALFDFVGFIVGAVQLALALLVPQIAAITVAVSIAITLNCLLNFITEAERFGSIFKSLLTFILVVIGVGVGFSILLVAIGGAAHLRG